MKILADNIKKKLSSKYTVSDSLRDSRSTDINVLLNRVRLDRKKEVKNKFYFSAATSVCLILFGLAVFS